jgi:hypothetical protein
VEITAASCGPDPTLIVATYSSSSWKTMMAALSCYEKFASEKRICDVWPFPVTHVQMFINWAVLEKDYSTSTVRAYINHLATLHKLKNLSEDSCKNFVNNAMINGAENLSFYNDKKPKQKNVMTLPLLRVLGHEISKSNWSDHSKLVIWGSCTTAFFGSFRLGELLSKCDTISWVLIRFQIKTTVNPKHANS